MICPKCMSSNVNIQAVSEQPQRDVLTVIMWILLALCTCGMLVLFVPLLSKPGSKITSRAVCQNCGHQWPVTGRGATQSEKFVLREHSTNKTKREKVVLFLMILFGLLCLVGILDFLFGLLL